MTERINDPVRWDPWMDIGIETVSGGTMIYGLNQEQVAHYNADPDLFAAKYLGFNTADEYREWIAVGGNALCGERTKSGRLCSRKAVSQPQLEPAEWLAHHRSEACRLHGGGQ